MSHFLGRPSIVTVTLQNANTEYEVILPTCTRYEVQPRQAVDIRLAYAAGDTADGRPYRTVKAALPPYREDGVVGMRRSVYLRAPTAGTVVEIVCWS